MRLTEWLFGKGESEHREGALEINHYFYQDGVHSDGTCKWTLSSALYRLGKSSLNDWRWISLLTFKYTWSSSVLPTEDDVRMRKELMEDKLWAAYDLRQAANGWENEREQG